MKKMRLVWMALAIATTAVFFSCAQPQPESNDDASGTEETKQDDEKKAREMIEKAEQMEKDTASG